MKSKIVVGIVFVSLLAGVAFGDPNTQIRYEAIDLGLGRWEYTYDVYNIGLTEGIDEFICE